MTNSQNLCNHFEANSVSPLRGKLLSRATLFIYIEGNYLRVKFLFKQFFWLVI